MTEQYIATSWEAKKHPTTWALPEEQMRAAYLTHSIMELIPVQNGEHVQFYGSY